jgi:hypothetical protein
MWELIGQSNGGGRSGKIHDGIGLESSKAAKEHGSVFTPFQIAFDMDWRSLRESETNVAEWRRHEITFAYTLATARKVQWLLEG